MKNILLQSKIANNRSQIKEKYQTYGNNNKNNTKQKNINECRKICSI
jgi:hypothetical protein